MMLEPRDPRAARVWGNRLTVHTFIAIAEKDGSSRRVDFYARTCQGALTIARAWGKRTGQRIEKPPDADELEAYLRDGGKLEVLDEGRVVRRAAS